MPTKVPLVLLVAFLVLLTLASVVVIILRAPNTADQLTLIGAIIAFMAPLLTSIIALFRAETANGVAKNATQALTDHLNGTHVP